MTADLAATPVNIRCLHSVFVDAVLNQQPDIANLLTTRVGGLHSLAFVDDVDRAEVLRIRSDILHDRLCYRVEVLSDHHGWVRLCATYAEDLGIEATREVLDAGIAAHAERLLRELTEGEDQ